MTSEQRLKSGNSERFGSESIREYLAICKRRKWWIFVTTVAVFFCVAGAVWRLGNVYRAETVIMVDPQQVPDRFVASTVTTTIADRLSTIQQQVLSPTRLSKLIDSMGLYPEMRGRVSEQAIVSMMQKATTVEVVTPGVQRLSAFTIAYRGKDPVEVARVTNQIADMFIQDNVEARAKEAEGTADFLESQLQDTKRQMDEKNAQLQAVRSRFVLNLPEAKEYHLQALTTLRNQLEASQERVREDQQQKVMLQSMEASVTNAPTVNLDSGMDPDMQTSPDKLQLRKLQSSLSALRARYGPNFPDVRKEQAEIDQLTAKIAEEEKTGTDQPALAQAPPIKIKNPVVDAQIHKIDDEIQEQLQLQPQLQAQINEHTATLEQVPVFEQQISGLTQDYDSLHTQYQSLLDKKLAAQMANALETRQKGERFIVLDPAVPPEKPYGPNRIVILLAGLLAGLAGGIGLAIAIDNQDESIRSIGQASRVLGKPVLAGIPFIASQAQIRRDTMRAFACLVGTAACSVLMGLLISRFLLPLL